MFRALSRSARLTRTVHHRGIPLNGVRVGSFSTLSFRPIPSSRPSYRPHLAPLALNAVPPLSRGYALRLDPVPKFNSVADLNKFMTQLEDFLKTGAQLVRTQEDIISTYESLLQVLWWNFRSVAYLAREISRRSSATGTAARRGFDPYILNVHERFKLTSLELKKLVENSMTTLEEVPPYHSMSLKYSISG